MHRRAARSRDDQRTDCGIRRKPTLRASAYKRATTLHVSAAIVAVIVFVLFSYAHSVSSAHTIKPPKLSIGYLGAWTTSAKHGYHIVDVPATELTHVIYAFAGFSTAPPWRCALGDPGADVGDTHADPVHPTVSNVHWARSNFAALLALKHKHPTVRTLISIGGWHISQTGHFADVIATPETRSTFVASCIALFVRRWPGLFDGFDIDWEFPSAQQRSNFTLLAAEFRKQLDVREAIDKRHHPLTLSLPAWKTPGVNYDLPKLATSVDWVNLMIYLLHRTGAVDPSTNFGAPLYASPKDPAGASINVDSFVKAYIAGGMPARKIVLGLPSAGHGFGGVPNVDHGLYQLDVPSQTPAGTFGEPGVIQYNDLVRRFFATFERHFDTATQSGYVYSPQTHVWVAYESPHAIVSKGMYVWQHELRGLMLFDLSGDVARADSRSLVRAMNEGLYPPPAPSPIVPAKPIVTKTTRTHALQTDIRWTSTGFATDWFQVDRQAAREQGVPVSNRPWKTVSAKLNPVSRVFFDTQTISLLLFNYRVCAGGHLDGLRVCSNAVFEGAFAPQHYLRFNGTSDRIDVPSSADFDVSAAGLTVAAWMRPDTLSFQKTQGSLPTQQYVHWLGKGSGPHEEWTFRMYSVSKPPGPRQNRMSFYVFKPNVSLGCGSYFQDPVDPGQWIHIVGVVNQQTQQTSIYKNGALRHSNSYASLSSGLAAGDTPLRIGSKDLTSFFKGAIGSVRIWNRPLSAAEVGALYVSAIVPQNGLVAQYLMDDGSGTIVNDSAGNHQGTVHGATWAHGSSTVNAAIGTSGGGC